MKLKPDDDFGLTDNQTKEIYVDSTSGEIFTEVIIDTLKNKFEKKQVNNL